MPRKSREELIDSGILSSRVAAEFLQISLPALIAMTESGAIEAIKVNHRERKITAQAIYNKAIELKIPICRDLLQSYKNFVEKFPDSASMPENEAKKLFSSITIYD